MTPSLVVVVGVIFQFQFVLLSSCLLQKVKNKYIKLAGHGKIYYFLMLECAKGCLLDSAFHFQEN